MNRDDFTGSAAGGPDGLRVAAPVTAPRRPAHQSGLPAVADSSVGVWETAYRRYGRISEQPLLPSEVGADAALQMAFASRAVADAWRQIGRTRSLPWWSLAAVESAAQAFEGQARDWEIRHQQIVSGEVGLR